MIVIVIVCSIIAFVIGFLYGGRYGVDSCSEYMNHSVILKHIKELIMNESISDSNKLSFLRYRLKDIEL